MALFRCEYIFTSYCVALQNLLVIIDFFNLYCDVVGRRAIAGYLIFDMLFFRWVVDVWVKIFITIIHRNFAS